MKPLLLACLLTFVFIPFPSFAAKKHCQSYRDKLSNIQSQQRQGYSLNKGKSLKSRETDARKKWWDCEQGKIKPKKSAKKKVKKSRTKKKVKLNVNNKPVKAPFASSGPLIAKQKYQGEQLQQWLSFYQRPKGCTKPKNMKQFTACIEDKNQQQLAFENKIKGS